MPEQQIRVKIRYVAAGLILPLILISCYVLVAPWIVRASATNLSLAIFGGPVRGAIIIAVTFIAGGLFGLSLIGRERLVKIDRYTFVAASVFWFAVLVFLAIKAHQYIEVL